MRQGLHWDDTAWSAASLTSVSCSVHSINGASYFYVRQDILQCIFSDNCWWICQAPCSQFSATNTPLNMNKYNGSSTLENTFSFIELIWEKIELETLTVHYQEIWILSFSRILRSKSICSCIFLVHCLHPSLQAKTIVSFYFCHMLTQHCCIYTANRIDFRMNKSYKF